MFQNPVGKGKHMPIRLFLTSAKVVDGPAAPGDIPVERFFVNASEVPEVWVDTEATNIPPTGKAASFVLARQLDLGFVRITGTIERKVQK